jgi:hypothetical protein
VESPQQLGLFQREAVAWEQPAAAGARAFYTEVIELAREPAFIAGKLAAVETSSPGAVIAYRRGDALVLVNARNSEVRFTVTGFDVKGARNLLGGAPVAGDTVTLPGYGAAVLER